MKTISLILILFMMAACGKKSGGGGSSTHESPPSPCCSGEQLEVFHTTQKLEVYWVKLNEKNLGGWSRSSSILARSIAFGQFHERQKRTLEINGTQATDKHLGQIFETFSQSLDDGDKPELKELAIKLITTKE